MKALQTIIAVATLLHAANTFAQTEEAEDATSYKAAYKCLHRRRKRTESHRI